MNVVEMYIRVFASSVVNLFKGEWVANDPNPEPSNLDRYDWNGSL